VVDCEGLKDLGGFRIGRRGSTRTRGHSRQTVVGEENQVDEGPVGGSLNLEVAEQAIGTESVISLPWSGFKRHIPSICREATHKSKLSSMISGLEGSS